MILRPDRRVALWLPGGRRVKCCSRVFWNVHEYGLQRFSFEISPIWLLLKSLILVTDFR
jgi:hypothetical protein